MKKSVICLFALMFGLLFSGFAAEKTVILVSQNKESLEKLNKDEKNYAVSTYQQFLVGLSKDSEITIRTDDTNSALRKIQKESQKELEKGLASDSYEIDQRELAKYSIEFTFKKESGSYQMIATVSDITKVGTSFSNSPKSKDISEITKDETVDKLTYDVLTQMSSRGYISKLSNDVVSQLLHAEDDTKTFEKYVADYAKQLSDTDKELEALRKQKSDAANKLALEDKERALLLHKEMLEKNKLIAEENLRKRQNRDAEEAKRKQELAAMKAGQQEEFLYKIKELEQKRIEIQKAERSNLSLKKRIELIEQGKRNLADLQASLDSSIAQSNEKIEKEMQSAVDAKLAEPYDVGDYTRDAEGNRIVTESAVKVRNMQVDKIVRKYNDEKKSVEKQMRENAAPSLRDYKSQIDTNIAELEKTTYGFRSIDRNQDYLTLQVDEFDGNTYSWTVHSKIEVNDIPKFKIDYSKLPDYDITYKMMTGKNPPDDKELARIENIKDEAKRDKAQEEYIKLREDYNTTVANANLYFRTSVPYLYSQVHLKVKYNPASDEYVASLLSFSIFKTEDNAKPLFTRNEKDFKTDRENEEKKERERQRKEEQARIAEEKKTEKERKEYEEEQRKLEEQREREESWNKWKASQHARGGLVLELGYLKTESFKGLDSSIQLLIGGRNFFVGGGIDIMKQYLKDGQHLAVSSSYASRDDFSCITGFGTIGYSLTLGKFAPYIGTGIGGYSFFVFTGNDTSSSSYSSSSSSKDKEPTTASLKGGFYWQNYIGLDYRFSPSISIGAAYKLKYFSGIGFADSFTAGLTFWVYK